jgi:glutamate carboxypeptidase
MRPAHSLPYFQKLQQPMLEQLFQYVRFESPTTDKSAVDRFGKEVARDLAKIGMSIEVNEQTERGNHMIARYSGSLPRILLIGHLDTVWDLGTLERMPVLVKGETAFGPGIFDMKAGIVICMSALSFLREQGLNHPEIVFLLNSDEEEGSETSQALIEREAIGARCAFVLEPAGPRNGIKTKRRGVGQYKIHITGKSAHAGVDPEKGVSAVEELARQILEVQSWNSQRPGVSVNTGVISGGTRSNVIPSQAYAIVDVRCDSPEDSIWIQDHFSKLRVHNPSAKLEVDGGLNRPPLVRSEPVLALYQEASRIANDFQYPVQESWTGGASDGNLTSAMGIPTLDGLGAEGEGAHALHEQISIPSLSKRANLLYHLIRSQFSP